MQDVLTVVMPIYDGVTHLDFTGPHQFLVRVPNAKVLVASMGGKSIEADGLLFCGLPELESIQTCDVLCIPGGMGCIAALEDDRFLDQICRLGTAAKYITSVCNGSLILGAAGLITGKRAACHWAWRDMLTTFDVIPDDARVVRDGNIITGGGVTAGIDLALTLIAELAGDDVAQSIQLRFEYAPAPPFEAGRPDTAPLAILSAVRERLALGLKDQHERAELVAANRRKNMEMHMTSPQEREI